MASPAVATSPAAVEEEPKEEGKEFVDLSSALEHLGLSEYQSTIEQEKIDLESFVRTLLACHEPIQLLLFTFNTYHTIKETLHSKIKRLTDVFRSRKSR